MRQRRVTGIEERLAPYADLILIGDGGKPSPLRHPATGWYERWYQRTSPRFSSPDIYEHTYVELGCGRGKFINALAAEDPEGLYIGVEGCKTIIIRGLEKTREAGLNNVRYIDAFVNDAEAAFGEGALDGVFLNFSDPWPKARHADRRLSAPAKTTGYYSALKGGGFVSLKTDGEEFYKYSLAAFTAAGFIIAVPACDIAAAGAGMKVAERAAATPTEYELKFRALGRPIYHFTAIKK